ncbi:MAG: cld [Dehalococcoidia bacterium]|nr:cld [Dehalococcoidia bacterium]
MTPDGRQFVRYAFYKLAPEWRRLAKDTKETQRQELVSVVDEFTDQMLVRPYTLMGTRGDADFLLWTVSDSVERFQSLATQVFSSGLGHYLTVPYSYLAMTRKSAYVDKHRHEGQEGSRLTIKPRGSKYLFVYPFAPGDFLDLVMALRETEGSKYTVRDTPVFTCTSMDMRQVLDSLGD